MDHADMPEATKPFFEMFICSFVMPPNDRYPTRWSLTILFAAHIVQALAVQGILGMSLVELCTRHLKTFSGLTPARASSIFEVQSNVSYLL